MRARAVFVVLTVAVCSVAAAAGDREAPPSPAGPAVDFVAAAPVVDGRLDPGLHHLPRRAFHLVEASDPALPVGEAAYRLAYGSDFLYLFVEAEGEALTYRDRAYQHGDGFHLVIGAPTADGAPTEEFYVVAASAVDRPAMEWSRRFIWYHNVEHLFLRFGPGAQMATAVADGRVGFELLLPWQELHPFHPWLSPGIGFNLALVRAAGATATVHHLVLEDRLIQSEQSPRRWAPLAFAPPPAAPDPLAFVQLERGHVPAATAARAVLAASCAEGAAASVRLELRAGEGGRLSAWSERLPCTGAVARRSVELPTADLPPGGYRLAWEVGALRGEGALTVLPGVAGATLEARLDALADRLPPGSLETLRFRLEEAQGELARLRPYETAPQQRIALTRLLAELARAEAGGEQARLGPGTHRRAFRSAQDGTLQPYVVRVPEDAGERPLPLLVYLHGSGSDERSLPPTERLSAGRALELAPRARGTSHAYVPNEARRDVVEAIAALARDLPVDDERVVLAGFSMGGYGALHTFLDEPERYRGVAVLSGHPDLANRWQGGGQPSFLDPEVLSAFAGVPVFVFHGTEDRNCPYELALEMVAGLRAAGAEVTFVEEAGAGHASMGEEALAAWRRWLEDVLAP